MKRTFVAILICGACAALLLADAPLINRFAMSKLEAQIDALFDTDMCNVLGNTRGVYLDGYGAVFTTLVNVRTELPNPFNDFTATKILQIHDTKLKELPALREKLRQSLLILAASPQLDSVRPGEQVVSGVTVFYYKWENTHGLPREIIMQAEKQKLLSVQSGRVPREQLEAMLKVQEQ